MSYRPPLEARLARKTTRAIADFNLIEDGQHMAIGNVMPHRRSVRTH